MLLHKSTSDWCQKRKINADLNTLEVTGMLRTVKLVFNMSGVLDLW